MQSERGKTHEKQRTAVKSWKAGVLRQAFESMLTRTQISYHTTTTPQHMDRLLARCGLIRRLGFFVVVPSAFMSSSMPILNKILQGKHPASSFLTWSLTVPADQYALVAGSDYYQPRHYVRPEPTSNDSNADFLLLALLSPGARASSNYELTAGRQRQLLEAFASFKHEEARDSLGPPPPDMTLPVSAREKEKNGGAEEWWW